MIQPPRSLFSVCFAPIKRTQDASGSGSQESRPECGELVFIHDVQAYKPRYLAGTPAAAAVHSAAWSAASAADPLTGTQPLSKGRLPAVPRRRWLWVGPQKGKEGNDCGPFTTAPFNRGAGRPSFEFGHTSVRPKPLAIQSCGLGRRMGGDCLFADRRRSQRQLPG